MQSSSSGGNVATLQNPPYQLLLLWLWRWLPPLLLTAGYILGHLQFSLWLVAERTGSGGSYAYKDWLWPVLLALSFLTACWVVWQAWRMRRLWRVLALWLLWGIAVFFSDRFLMYSQPEYIHYPQYALLALLLARAIDPQRSLQAIGRILFWTTLLGMLDELLQYLWITVSYSAHLDFNDFLCNMLGGVAGLLLYYGRPPPAARADVPVRPVRRGARVEWWLSGLLTLLLVAGMAGGRIVVEPDQPVPPGGIQLQEVGNPWSAVLYLQRTVPASFNRWNRGPYRGRYWILGPGSGMLLLLGGGLAFHVLMRRWLIGPVGRV